MHRRDDLPLLDSVRALGALSIMSLHAVYQPWTALGVNSWGYAIGVHLDIGVPIFFSLSGFLLYRAFLLRRERDGTLPSVRRYALRRVLRIVPAYWLAIAVIALWIGTPGVWTAEHLPRYLLFAKVYDPATAIRPFVIGQTWSLDVEVVFYALVPLFAVLVLRRRLSVRGELLALAAIALGSWCWTAAALTQVDRANEDSFPLLLSFPAYADQFAIGMALAVLAVRVRPDRLPSLVARLRRSPGLCWAIALLLFLACGVVGSDGTSAESDREYYVTHLLYGSIAALVITPGAFGEPVVGYVRRFLNWRVLRYLGRVSYSLFLLHLAVVEQLARWLDVRTEATGWALWQWLLWWLAVASCATAAASVSYWLVERPLMRWHRRSRSEPPSRGFAGAPA